MKLLPQHQNSFSFSTKLLLSLCSLTLIIAYMSIHVYCLAAINYDKKSSDRLALIALKNEITEDPLGILSSWNDRNNSLHFCEWTGVTCSLRHRSRVTSIDLRSQRLVGSISSHIGNLSFLKTLNLFNNSLHGEIPQQIGRLSRLTSLNLSNNSMEGEIPHNISHCSNLIHLNISGNNFLGIIPKELGYLSNLKVLRLGENNLSGEIPPSLVNLSSSLTHLDLLLEVNRLSGIVPSSLYNISLLEIFSLLDNHLHGNIPFDIGFTLPNLWYFSVAINNFTGTVPSSLSNSSRLKIIQLGHNSLVGSVPYNLSNLKSLEVLHLRSNKLGNGQANDLDFLNSLVHCRNLRWINLNENSFGGELPSSIANLTTKLDTLNFGDNQIHGSIPAGIQNLLGLTSLTLSSNQFIGGIPPGIGHLQNLGLLYLQENKFSGSLPASFGNLTQLLHLISYHNKLTGLIPSNLGDCKALQVLDLSGNRLSGRIPKRIFDLPSLSRILNLANNSFTGVLPVEVGNLKNIGEISLSNNKLSGEIPSTIGECLSLTVLRLDGNFFQGNIPPSFTFLRGLVQLSLSYNNLSGTIPNGFENIALSMFDISYNNLEGVVPKNGVFKNRSEFLFEGNTKLCGGEPDLKLPNCSVPINPNMVWKQRISKPAKVITISIVVAVLLVTLVVFSLYMYWRRNSETKTPSTTLDIGNHYMGVSYSELLEATNGFNDSTNLLGVGSFGSVYKGILGNDESKPVAVKVLHLQQRGATKSFLAECDTLGKVRHRNLLKIVTCCSSTDFQGNPFKALVFDFMVNGSLESWLHPVEVDTSDDDQLHVKNLDLERRLSIAFDIASALNYLHHDSESPIVHCDVKPSNVLLDDDYTAHVGDFGLAKFLSIPPSNSRRLNEQDASSIAIKGSIGYVSPEYGMGCEVSTHGDVYSYGILLLEMFTGKRPTDDMFKDGLNIHDFTKMHEFPERIEEVIDSRLLLELREDHNDAEIANYNISRNERRNIDRDAMRQIFASIIQIGVKCSSELPSDRCCMNEVIVDVQAVKSRFHAVGM
ncbi:hypothetical protein MKX03_011540 [Papaver bracteatum]|nr:hypothetical protein MKX03_011540 [Papaver bracteatum]